MDRLEETRVPKAWLNEQVELKFHLYRSDPDESGPGDLIKTNGTLADVNDLGVVIKVVYAGRLGHPGDRPCTEVTFYPWTSIKSMTHQPEPRDEELAEALDEVARDV